MKNQYTAQRKREASAAFTNDEVRQIRKALANGVSRIELARVWGVGKETIARLARGETYGWVEDDEEMQERAEARLEAQERFGTRNVIPESRIEASKARMLELLAKEGKEVLRDGLEAGPGNSEGEGEGDFDLSRLRKDGLDGKGF